MNDNDSDYNERLLRDKEVARMIGMSPEYIRNQRFKRRRGIPHVLDVDPVMLDKTPRYLCAEIIAFKKRLENARL